jgi:hypothetical protein
VYDGPPSGGLRWSTRITSTMTGDHTASPDAGALRQESHVVSRGGVLRHLLATDRFHHPCTIWMIRANKARLPRVRSAATPRTMRSHAWLRRNVRQRWDVVHRPGPGVSPLGRYLQTVLGETHRPSLSRSSLAIRRWPQVRFSRAIWRMSLCNSAGIGGRPGHGVQCQNRWYPWRCHRLNVSGCTTARAGCQSNHCDSQSSVIRAACLARRGVTWCSWYRASCLRRNRFSAAKAGLGRRQRHRKRETSRKYVNSVEARSITAWITLDRRSYRRARTSGALPGNGADFCACIMRMARGTYLRTAASCLRTSCPT